MSRVQQRISSSSAGQHPGRDLLSCFFLQFGRGLARFISSQRIFGFVDGLILLLLLLWFLVLVAPDERRDLPLKGHQRAGFERHDFADRVYDILPGAARSILIRKFELVALLLGSR